MLTINNNYGQVQTLPSGPGAYGTYLGEGLELLCLREEGYLPERIPLVNELAQLKNSTINNLNTNYNNKPRYQPLSVFFRITSKGAYLSQQKAPTVSGQSLDNTGTVLPIFSLLVHNPLYKCRNTLPHLSVRDMVLRQSRVLICRFPNVSKRTCGWRAPRLHKALRALKPEII
ncbi:hypothetical protein J6590_057128 [Homalodisca vitripennis]|nr:hypothetical protein J6590_057128 [Homalodisca vitripennis]